MRMYSPRESVASTPSPPSPVNSIAIVVRAMGGALSDSSSTREVCVCRMLKFVSFPSSLRPSHKSIMPCTFIVNTSSSPPPSTVSNEVKISIPSSSVATMHSGDFELHGIVTVGRMIRTRLTMRTSSASPAFWFIISPADAADEASSVPRKPAKM